jgi:hypothetical protein
MAAVRKVPRPDERDDLAFPASYTVVFVSLVATTLWAQDSIQPVTLIGPHPRLVHWPDSFYHARLISAFANQAAGAPLQSMNAAGEPASIYHYASYVLPAALSAFTGTPGYATFSSFMLPVGILLTGLAAYGMGVSFWGKAGGLAAAAALLLLPDTAQQGIHNHWYSYQFLQQVNPGQLFGVATMAAAWVYMLDACKTGRLVSLAASYALAVVCITYKAQFFVANAFLLWVFPALFFGALSRRKRLAWVAFAAVSYWLALKLAEGIPSMPTIRTDVRSLLRSGEWIARNFDSESIRTFLLQFVPKASDSQFHSVAWICGMAVIIFIVTFGVFGPLYVRACLAIAPGRQPNGSAFSAVGHDRLHVHEHRIGAERQWQRRRVDASPTRVGLFRRLYVGRRRLVAKRLQMASTACARMDGIRHRFLPVSCSMDFWQGYRGRPDPSVDEL